MHKSRWYNKSVSKIVSNQDDNQVGSPMQSEENKKQESLNSETNLDVNLIIATFQEKLSGLMIELIIKEATIKQQAIIIKRLRGE